MCVCVCVFIKLHITAQSGLVILVILCHSRWSSQGGSNDTCYENLWSGATEGTHSLYLYKSYLSPEHLVLPPLLPCCSPGYPSWQLLNQPFLFYIFSAFHPCLPRFRHGVDSFFEVVFVCCHPIYSGRQVCGRTSRGHTEGRSHRISPRSSCGACLNFSREKDSAIPFPRRPWDRILCTYDIIDLHLGISSFFYLLFFVKKNPSSCDDIEIRTHVPMSEGFEVTNWTTAATGSISTSMHAGTFNMPTPYQQWVWEREVHINWSAGTCQGSTRLELPWDVLALCRRTLGSERHQYAIAWPDKRGTDSRRMAV